MTNPRATIADALHLEFRDDPNSPCQINYTFACHLAETVIQQLRDAGYHITNQGTPNQPYKYPDDDIQCPCGDTVPANIAYRDGPQPFHWNNEGGGHTMDPETWKRWKQQETNNEC